MADSKITALTALTSADPANDMIPIVDVSDTPPASGNTKRISINNILAASGTATLASATITGAATVGTTLGVTGASTLASVGVTGAATVGTTLLVGTNATLTNGNVIIGTSGKGIDFSAVTGGTGTATANVLNDYEEGTWTPTDGSGAGLVFTVSACRYTKVGRAVTVQGNITYPVTVSAANANISGFPFNSADGIYLDIKYSDASIASLTYLFPLTSSVNLSTPGLSVLNSTVSGKYISFSGTYMI